MRKEFEAAKTTAGHLEIYAKGRLEEVAAELRQELRPLDAKLRFIVGDEPPDGERSHWFRREIIEVAHQLGYFADVASYRAWVSLLLLTADSRAEIVLSFHGIGREFRGVLGVSGMFFRREETEEGERQVTDLTSLTDEVFQINYVEDGREALMRFERWLNDALVRGLETWRRGL